MTLAKTQPMKLTKTTNRLIAHGNQLWDSSEPIGESGLLTLLPATDAQVRQDIEALLTTHNQRDLPPAKPKKEVKPGRVHMAHGEIKCKKDESHEVVLDTTHDAYYCVPCNKWLEPKCKDPACNFCPTRPRKPLKKETKPRGSRTKQSSVSTVQEG